MKKIAIVAGEPESINSEIIAKAWKKFPQSLKKRIFIIGNCNLLKKQLRKIKIKVPIAKINKLNFKNSKKYLPVYDIPLKFKNPYKIKENNNSKYVLKCINKAHEFSKKKYLDGFVNCPIDKRKVFGEKKIGLTEYLSLKNRLKIKAVMLIYNKKLSVTPITTHINIRNVSKSLNKKLIEKKILILNKFYNKIFKRKPSIAVLGLNPHNDEFRKNSEETKIIIPAIKKLKKFKIKVFGPFPSDTAFSNQKKSNYDIIVGMYHDQVLGPYKAIYNFDAINITLGLDYLRVSPDHGTGKDIIGKRKASPFSLIKSVIFLSNIKQW